MSGRRSSHGGRPAKLQVRLRSFGPLHTRGSVAVSTWLVGPPQRDIAPEHMPEAVAQEMDAVVELANTKQKRAQQQTGGSSSSSGAVHGPHGEGNLKTRKRVEQRYRKRLAAEAKAKAKAAGPPLTPGAAGVRLAAAQQPSGHDIKAALPDGAASWESLSKEQALGNPFLTQAAKDGLIAMVDPETLFYHNPPSQVRGTVEGDKDYDEWLQPVSYTHLTLPTKRIV